jgi:hypothetical protein
LPIATTEGISPFLNLLPTATTPDSSVPTSRKKIFVKLVPKSMPRFIDTLAGLSCATASPVCRWTAQLHCRRFRAVSENPRHRRIGRRHPDVDRLRPGEGQRRFEYSVLIVLSTLGMLMLISAADLNPLYLGLELMSLLLYVVAASHRNSLRSSEAGLKYFVLGALSSSMLLYGASLVYGFTGTVSFAGIAHSAASAGTGLIFGLVFLFAGFCFKVSAVPFHIWTPGAPTPVTAFFAAAVKVAGSACSCGRRSERYEPSSSSSTGTA